MGDLKELFHGKKTENMVKKRKNGGKMKYMVKKMKIRWVEFMFCIFVGGSVSQLKCGNLAPLMKT